MAHTLEIKISINVFSSATELPADEQNLLQQAQAATRKAYAPYSNFLVGAALLLEDGSIHLGNNQENAAFPSGLCAERTALFGMRANIPDKKISKIAVTAQRANQEAFVLALPCGACRQVMSEYENQQEAPITVLMQADNGQVYRCESVSALLPLQFTRHNLGL
ncbi:cytidine deaminase [Adhaeribacter aerolatus]|uniref:Cytidine deaminase n=1 Tax=Adhaeribacter aerolatus TaxID=670289 RepID=A0A512ATK6_9BACT|nr:cytidine deaminase [Adhaeribacter aerolatus]GEO03051.1 cytidine deaminase [Adhaeribacter aerolatus]